MIQPIKHRVLLYLNLNWKTLEGIICSKPYMLYTVDKIVTDFTNTIIYLQYFLEKNSFILF